MVNANLTKKRILYNAIICILIGCILGILFERYFGKSKPVEIKENFSGPEVSTEGRIAVDLSNIPKSNLMVALVFGQSNSANYGEQRYTGSNQHVFNFFNEKIYLAEDPLLGATGSWGSVWTRLGDQLVSHHCYKNIIFVPIGVGSSSIAQWAPGGDLHQRILDAIKQVKACGLEFTHLFWHQGETDSFVLHTSKTLYKQHFASMVNGIRAANVKAPIYVSVATRGRRNRGDPEIAQAQREVVNNRDILAGPDTDRLGFAYRFDGVHFSTEGLAEVSKLWFALLAKECAMPTQTRP